MKLPESIKEAYDCSECGGWGYVCPEKESCKIIESNSDDSDDICSQCCNHNSSKCNKCNESG